MVQCTTKHRNEWRDTELENERGLPPSGRKKKKKRGVCLSVCLVGLDTTRPLPRANTHIFSSSISNLGRRDIGEGGRVVRLHSGKKVFRFRAHPQSCPAAPYRTVKQSTKHGPNVKGRRGVHVIHSPQHRDGLGGLRHERRRQCLVATHVIKSVSGKEGGGRG